MNRTLALAAVAAVSAGCTCSSNGPTEMVLQHHNGPSRSGLYVEPAFTKDAIADAGVHRDPGFAGDVSGQVYAQPLYVEGTSRDLVIVATQTNNVYALDAIDGGVVWQRTLATPVTSAALPCGNIAPTVGVTGTPAVDPGSRILYIGAMTVGDGGVEAQQLFALGVDDGSLRPGWPVDMNTAARSGSASFVSTAQGSRSALLVLDGRVYAPYGGISGDCGSYRGWIVGVSTANPTDVQAWATRSGGSGIWAVGGAASDGTSIYAATGNAIGAGSYGDQESVLKLGKGPVFSGGAADYWAPANWPALDSTDADLSGSGPMLLDLPNSTPAALVLALGKDGYAYLLNRTNLGGIAAPVASLRVATNAIIQAGATYRTSLGTYVVAAGNGNNCPAPTSGDLVAFKIEPGTPPTMPAVTWCASQGGRSSPVVTTTDGTLDAIVWTVGGNRLRAFDGDTGAQLYSGASPGDALAGVRNFQSAIVAKGRIYVAGDNRVFAFKRP